MATLLIETGLPVPRDVAAAVHARTDGIPLHVEELLAVLAESGASTGAGAVREADVPETVEEAILARIEPCSAPARQLAAAGAVIGRAFDLDLLSTVLDVPLERLSAPLAELADQFVLLPARGAVALRLPPRPDLRRDLRPHPGAERRRLHARTADAAVGTDVGTDAFLALHYERAGRRAEAFAAALRGAANASAISSHPRRASSTTARSGRRRRTAAAATRPAPRAIRRRAAAATDDNEAASDGVRSRPGRAISRPATRLAAAAVVGPLVAVRHLLGDGLEVRADALRVGAGRDRRTARRPPAPSRIRRSDRVRARLLGGLAAAYMLDRRLDECDRLRPRRPAAGGPCRG